jgi:16S rRNA (adenine1518-N6/adenine1519-N6)-dimethyltransferase
LPPSAAEDELPGARELLARHGLRPKKSWGQNFLVDPNVRRRIVAAAQIEPDDVVVEIGAGLGALTGLLAQASRRVIAIERDPELVPVLRASLPEHVTIAAVDALSFDFGAAAREAGRPLVVLGNLPYQITSPLIFALLDSADRGHTVGRAVVMVQREVAERVVAAPGSKIYGRLSVMVQQQAAVEMLFSVKPGSFHPPPAVTSTVMRLAPRAAPLAPVSDDQLFAEVVKAAFGTRRKMLRRALAPAFGEAIVHGALARAKVDETRRAEELSVLELGRVAAAIAEERAGA